MQNTVPILTEADDAVSRRVAARTVADRQAVYAAEVRQFLDAAFEVIEAHGDVDAPVRGIVRTAGLSNQAFYRHFASKDELLIALLQDGRRQLVETIERRLARAEPGLDRVRAWCHAVLAQAGDPVAAARSRPFSIDGPRLSNRFPVEAQESTENLVRPLRDALAEAGADADALAPTVAAFTLGALHEALIQRRLLGPADVEQLTDFILRGAELIPLDPSR